MQIGTHFKAVDHDINGVLFLLVELGQLVQFAELAVDPGPDKALGAQFFKHRKMLALALANYRRQQHQFAALRLRQHQVDHLAHGLGFQRNVVIRAARDTYAGIQQTQVIVDFGDGANRGTRVVRGRFLLDGNRR